MKMTKVNKPGSHKPEANKPKKLNEEAQLIAPKVPQELPTNSSAASNKSRPKANRPGIGGTAVPGARSTQPKEVKAATQAQQQSESYNREMRRRMQHLGTGPYSENPTMTAREKRQKRLERKKQERLEEVQKTIAKAPKINRSLGRRNTYFLIAVAAILILIILLFLIIRHPF